MKQCLGVLIAFVVCVASLPAAAQQCLATLDAAKMLDRLVLHNDSYGDVPSTVKCNLNIKAPVEKLICGNNKLRAMELIDTRAYVYAVENATRTQRDHKTTRDTQWIDSVRNKCTTEECLCTAFKAHTDASLGGTSQYYERK